MKRLLFFAACISVVLAQSSSPKPIEPKFLEFLSADKSTTTTSSTTTVTPTTTTTKASAKSDSEDALANVLKRQDELKKQLDQVRNTLAQRASDAAPAAAAVIPTRTGAEDPQARAAANQEQSNQLAQKLLGSNGLLSLLNPKIMDQDEAANKLIPSLASNPSVAKFQQMQMQPQPQARQLPFQSGQQAFPYNPQLPVQGGQMNFPQQLSPNVFQQPQLAGGQLGSPLGFGGAGFGGAPNAQALPMNYGGGTGYPGAGFGTGMMG